MFFDLRMKCDRFQSQPYMQTGYWWRVQVIHPPREIIAKATNFSKNQYIQKKSNFSGFIFWTLLVCTNLQVFFRPPLKFLGGRVGIQLSNDPTGLLLSSALLGFGDDFFFQSGRDFNLIFGLLGVLQLWNELVLRIRVVSRSAFHFSYFVKFGLKRSASY